MSIAFEMSNNRIEGSGFLGGMSCISIVESTEPARLITGILHGDRRISVSNLATAVKKVEENEEKSESCSSSIGKNSDFSGQSTLSDGEDSGETEVQSSYKGPMLSMEALEEVLPIRRGISNFYSGKSKSFTSLAEATSSSTIKDIAKPENAYTRKRKNLLAHSIMWDKNRGILKRPANLSRSTLALAVAKRSLEMDNESVSSSSLVRVVLPPLHPQAKPLISDISPSSPRSNFSPWRSFSLADLQGATSSAITDTVIKHKNLH